MKKTNLSDFDPTSVPNGKGYRVGIIAAEWNPEVTNAMCQGAFDTLREHGVLKKDITVIRVPGTYELTTAANIMLDRTFVDAVICIGCVIQGETRHFEFICQAVSQGLTNVALKHNKPVIFSVLTCDTMQQALDRAGGCHGNKGVEGAVTALKMIHLDRGIVFKAPF
ncbi:MAG: 6,7-dimethyl-8-ribityllumazine synthase [Bacteroidales bacterium]|nr:6,7-dimethyl-8-ribityllumazine synthase [Bacteroidales bacterium]